MVVRVDIASVTLAGVIFAVFLALACWNVLSMRRSGPHKLLAAFAAECKSVAKMLDAFERRVVSIEVNEESRRVAAVKLQREFMELIEQQDDVLERIDTKRRRIDASESRRARREEVGQDPQSDVTSLDSVRASARAQGLL